MRFPNHVSVVWDLTAMFDWGLGLLSLHDQLLLVPPVTSPVPIAPAMEFPAFIMRPEGLVTGAHKLTDTVYHNHVWIALKGHDLGMALAHMTLPNDLLLPIHMLLSSRKATFGAGEVKANNTALACCTIIDPPGLPTPLNICGKIKVPYAGTGTAVWGNTLIVGQHWIDILMGWAENIISACVDAVMIGSGRSKVPGMLEALVSPNFMPDFGSLVAAAIGLAGQLGADYHGDVSFEYKVGFGPLGEVGSSISRSGEDGTVTRAEQVRIGTGATNVHGGAEGRIHPDGQGGWTTDRGVSGGGNLLGAGGGGGVSSDRGAQSSTSGWNSPVSEGTTWGDLPLL